MSTSESTSPANRLTEPLIHKATIFISNSTDAVAAAQVAAVFTQCPYRSLTLLPSSTLDQCVSISHIVFCRQKKPHTRWGRHGWCLRQGKTYIIGTTYDYIHDYIHYWGWGSSYFRISSNFCCSLATFSACL